MSPPSHRHFLTTTRSSHIYVSNLPNSEQYRQQIQQHVTDYVQGRHPHNSYLRSMSTGRLILEATLEAVQIYRIQKEANMRLDMERSEQRGRKHTRRYRRGTSHEREHTSHADDESHNRDHREAGRAHEPSRDKRQHRRQRKAVPDPVTEGHPDLNPEYMVSRAAGPPSQTNNFHTSAQHTITEIPIRPISHGIPSGNAGNANITNSSTCRLGSDGKTLSSALPTRNADEGFLTHAMNTYRHIKAEHDSGHRVRSAVERKVDEMRKKKETNRKDFAGPSEKMKKSRQLRRGESSGMNYGEWIENERKMHNHGVEKSAPDVKQSTARGQDQGKQKVRVSKLPSKQDDAKNHASQEPQKLSATTPRIPAMVFETPAPPAQHEYPNPIISPVDPHEVPPRPPAPIYPPPESTDEPPSPRHIPIPVAQDFLPASPSLPTPSRSANVTPDVAVLRNSPARKPVVRSAAEEIKSHKIADEATKPKINIRRLNTPGDQMITSENKTYHDAIGGQSHRETKHSQAVRQKERTERARAGDGSWGLWGLPKSEVQRKTREQWENRKVSQSSDKPAYEDTPHSQVVKHREREQAVKPSEKKSSSHKRAESKLQKKIREKWQEHAARSDNATPGAGLNQAEPTGDLSSKPGSPSWTCENLGKKN